MPAGFSLVEILVAIAILFLVMTLIVAVGASMRRSARRQACLVAFEHAKDAQAIYFSKSGTLVDETDAAGWWVRTGEAEPRPMTSMEYFVFTLRQGSADAYAHLLILGDQLAPSTERNGPVLADGTRLHGTVRIYPSLQSARHPHAVPLHTLYDPAPGNPDTPQALRGNLGEEHHAPLRTLIDPWDAGEWKVDDWRQTTVKTDAGTTDFWWRPHEMDYRRLTAHYDIGRAEPLFRWHAHDALTPPYLPLCEGMLVSSPGPDGLWGTLDPANPAKTLPPHGLTNRGNAPGQPPRPPFPIEPPQKDDAAQDNLYSSENCP